MGHDKTLDIDLNYVSIGYRDIKGIEGIEEMQLLKWRMIENGGDIPMHRIEYFILYLFNNKSITIWDKKSKLDRLFCSGNTNKKTESLKALLSNIPNSKPKTKNYEAENKEDFDINQQNENECIQTLDALEINAVLDHLNKSQYEISLSHNKMRLIQAPALNKKLKRSDYRIIA